MFKKTKNFLFQNTNAKQTIIKNFFWLSFGVSLSKILKSIVIIYAARILGVGGYGVFTYALSFAAIFNIFSDIGLSNLLTRDLIKKDDKKSYLATALSIKIILSLGTIIFIGFVAPMFTNIQEAKDLMLITAILITFDGLRNFLFSIYRSANKMQFEAILEILTEIIITISCITVLFKHPSVMNFSLAYMVASGIGFIITIITTSKYLSNTMKNFKKGLLIPIIKSALPFTVVGIFGVLMTNIDSVIIGFLRPVQDLGLFGAAQRPISIIYLIPGFMYTALLPFFSKFAKDKDKLVKFTEKSIIISLGLALPIVIGGAILAKPIINVIYGYNFIESANVFSILLITMIPIFPGTILSAILLAKDKQKVFIRSTFYGAIINIAFDFLLIPKYGIEGSAFATVLAQLTANGILFFEIKKEMNLNIMNKFKKIILSLIVMTVSTFILKLYKFPLIIIFASSVFTYFILLILLKEEIIDDIKLIKS
jgi:O-antigen/teichoic acid export membrane protein